MARSVADAVVVAVYVVAAETSTAVVVVLPAPAEDDEPGVITSTTKLDALTDSTLPASRLRPAKPPP
jgi:hypothetical protein